MTAVDQITTVSELDALPVSDVLLRASGRYPRGGDTFSDCWVRPVPQWITGDADGPRLWQVLTYGDDLLTSLVRTEDIYLPATVLYYPDAPRVAPGGDTDRLSQAHADALAVLDFVADRMDEFAYGELHSVLEDGVLLRDEDGSPRHQGRLRPAAPRTEVDREALAAEIEREVAPWLEGHVNPRLVADRVATVVLDALDLRVTP